jgi:hypothetical protein
LEAEHVADAARATTALALQHEKLDLKKRQVAVEESNAAHARDLEHARLQAESQYRDKKMTKKYELEEKRIAADAEKAKRDTDVQLLQLSVRNKELELQLRK